jgi:hypothetical protein
VITYYCVHIPTNYLTLPNYLLYGVPVYLTTTPHHRAIKHQLPYTSYSVVELPNLRYLPYLTVHLRTFSDCRLLQLDFEHLLSVAESRYYYNPTPDRARERERESVCESVRKTAGCR